jgi:hypothetical protein
MPPDTDRNRGTACALSPRADPGGIAEINPLRLCSKRGQIFHHKQRRAAKPDPVWVPPEQHF